MIEINKRNLKKFKTNKEMDIFLDKIFELLKPYIKNEKDWIIYIENKIWGKCI